jgi:hypothetical protein
MGRKEAKSCFTKVPQDFLPHVLTKHTNIYAFTNPHRNVCTSNTLMDAHTHRVPGRMVDERLRFVFGEVVGFEFLDARDPWPAVL